MIRREEIYKIGMLNKPHGVHGELLFTFTDDSFDGADCDYLICLMEGIPVPFFIQEYRFRSDTTALVKFEGVDTSEQARRFTNTEVYFPKEYAMEQESESGDLSWDFFVGFRVQDTEHAELGEIIEVDTSTVNTLFVLKHPKGEELLIPACEEFIVEVDREKRSITLELPEGLLNLDGVEEL